MKTLLISFLLLTQFTFAQLKQHTKQVIIGVANGPNSSHVTLSMFEKKNNQWVQIDQAWKGRIGRNGLAWGLGMHPAQKGLYKKEGDGRAPAGIFDIGGAYGYATTIKKNKLLPYRQITVRDLWVEDSKSKYYNQHLVLKHPPKTTWQKKAQMRQNDHAHSLKLHIGHNTPTKAKPAKPYAGSSIFFHIWRGGGTKPTAGCTTMAPDKLKRMISLIDPKKNPAYILLTSEDYKKYRSAWKLP